MSSLNSQAYLAASLFYKSPTLLACQRFEFKEIVTSKCNPQKRWEQRCAANVPSDEFLATEWSEDWIRQDPWIRCNPLERHQRRAVAWRNQLQEHLANQVWIRGWERYWNLKINLKICFKTRNNTFLVQLLVDKIDGFWINLFGCPQWKVLN